MTSNAPPRLSRDKWLDAGLDALCANGPATLRAEALARRLGVTKGSFYWHFEDVPAFHAALLDRWSDTLRAQVAQAMDAQSSDTARLRHLCQLIAGGQDGGAWPAIRAWAQSDQTACDAIIQMDAAMMATVETLLGSLGVRNPEMARIIYAAATGLAGMKEAEPARNTDAAGSLVDLVLALR